jgi:hypothetical protein
VRSPERDVVPEVLDLGLMAWLVDEAPSLPLTWELQRDRLLCRTRDLDAERFPDLVQASAAFARHLAR